VTETDRRRTPDSRREALWSQAADLHSRSGPEVERVRATVVALLEARRDGASEALLHLARELEASGTKADPGLLRALADGYQAGQVEAGPS
jgi:hypothetical protein